MGCKAVVEISELSPKSFTLALDFFPLDFRRAPTGPVANVLNKALMIFNTVTLGRFGGASAGGTSDHDTIITGGTSAREGLATKAVSLKRRF